MKISIYGTDYRVVRRKHADLGNTDTTSKLIKLDPTLGAQPARAVLAHEVMHALVYESGAWEELVKAAGDDAAARIEEQIACLAPMLVQIMDTYDAPKRRPRKPRKKRITYDCTVTLHAAPESTFKMGDFVALDGNGDACKVETFPIRCATVERE